MFNFLKKPQTGTQLTLKIGGMHCTSCALSIDDALEDLPGVLSSDTNYVASQVTVVYTPEVVTPDIIVATISKQGYQVLTQ